MTLTHLDLDRIEGLAGRLREEAPLADESDLDYPHYTEGALLIEAADALTALITRIREVEGALTSVRQRAKNARGAIESNQVTDKDVHSSMTWILETIDVALQRKTS